jgi:prepilin-type processing-associated H-X9-DG protein
MYLDENNDAFPPNINKEVAGGAAAMPSSCVVGNVQTDVTTSNIQSGVLYKHVNGTGVYRCPGDKSIVKGTGVPHTRSYSISIWLNGDTQGGTPSAPVNISANIAPLIKTRLTQLSSPPPSQTFVFMEENEQSIDDGMMVVPNPMLGDWHTWGDMPSDRHNAVGNVSFADGHVEPVKWRYPKRYSSHQQSVGPAKEDWQDFRRAQSWVPVK